MESRPEGPGQTDADDGTRSSEDVDDTDGNPEQDTDAGPTETADEVERDADRDQAEG